MNPKQIGIGILVLAIIAIAVMQFSKTGNNTSETQTMEVVSPTVAAMERITAPEDSSAMTASQYKDGEYTATGNYTSPAQQEEVEITLTLENGLVTDAVFNGKGVHETTKKMQGLFSQGFTEEVVGKPIDEINLTVVNGSSLTPKGFMDALEKVKEEAAQA